MAEELIIKGENKKDKYVSLIQQVKALTEGENDFIANLANISSAIKYGMNFFWVGFYFIKNNELVLGPFQGTIACTRIKKGKGVCGTSWETQQTQIVEDVDLFPGHIACSSASKSEIVVPIFDSKNQVIGVLDIDDDKYASFDDIDKVYLEEICKLIGSWI